MIQRNWMIIDNIISRVEKELRGFILYHQPPIRRMISYDRVNYFLSFPDIIFRVGYFYFPEDILFSDDNHTMVWFTDKTLSQVCFPMFPNLGSRLSVCMENVGSYHSLENLVKNKISDFWQSNFNDDGSHIMELYRIRDGSSNLHDFFGNWQAKTKEDPEYIPENFIPLEGLGISDYKSKVWS